MASPKTVDFLFCAHSSVESDSFPGNRVFVLDGIEDVKVESILRHKSTVLEDWFIRSDTESELRQVLLQHFAGE